MDGTPVDVGQIIADTIEGSAPASPSILGFHFFITQLCLRHNVPIGREPRKKTIPRMTARYIAGRKDQAHQPMDHPHLRVPCAASQEDKDFNVHQEMERIKRKIEFLVDYHMKLAALIADKLQLDVSQLPHFDEGHPSRVQEPDKENEEEEEEMDK